jgi:imidazolonepropionase-like amidohydrolase
MAALGMSPAQVLVAATSGAAHLLGWNSKVGRLAPGFDADLVVIDGDPLDFTDLRSRITAVYRSGELVGGPDFAGRL